MGVGEPTVVAFAPADQERLGLLEEPWIEERLGARPMPRATEGDLAQVRAIAKHVQDDLGAPGLPRPGSEAVRVQLASDGGRAEASDRVATEDPLDDRKLTGLPGQPLVGVKSDSVRTRTPGPFTPRSFALHASDDPIDDRGPLELGEHSEELRQHPPSRSRGVDRFGGRAERYACAVEFLEEMNQDLERAREAIHSVHEQDVVQAQPCIPKRLGEPGRSAYAPLVWST
ncbi:MAG TPA: hypothetical protein VGB19_12265 [Actinomycetota bacterium]